MNDRLRIALYQPDIAGNTGTILRFAACLDIGVDIIEPAGFPLSDRALKRAGMDYLEMAALSRHADWHAFEEWRKAHARRLVLLTTKASAPDGLIGTGIAMPCAAQRTPGADWSRKALFCSIASARLFTVLAKNREGSSASLVSASLP